MSATHRETDVRHLNPGTSGVETLRSEITDHVHDVVNTDQRIQELREVNELTFVHLPKTHHVHGVQQNLFERAPPFGESSFRPISSTRREATD